MQCKMEGWVKHYMYDVVNVSRFCQLGHNDSFKRSYLVDTQLNEEWLGGFVETRVIVYLQLLTLGTVRYLKMHPSKPLLKIL